MSEIKSIAQIKEELKAANATQLPFLIQAYENDQRAGVQALLEKERKKQEKLEKEDEE